MCIHTYVHTCMYTYIQMYSKLARRTILRFASARIYTYIYIHIYIYIYHKTKLDNSLGLRNPNTRVT